VLKNIGRGVGHRIRILVACAAVGVTGAVFVAIALANQHHAPQPSTVTAQAPVSTEPAPTLLDTQAPPSVAPLSPSASTPAGLSASVPTRITIPSLGVNATFVPLGLNADGTIAVPTDVTHVGFYSLGPTPGQIGPAILLGHVDSAANGPGVFFKLGAAKVGDTIRIDRSDGKAVTFAVYAVREYPKDKFPTTTVYGNTADPQLRLITCGGGFDRASGHYLSNIVAFARQI